MIVKMYRNYNGSYSASCQYSAKGAVTTVVDNAKTEKDCLFALSSLACMPGFDGVEIYRVLTFDRHDDELELIARIEKQ